MPYLRATADRQLFYQQIEGDERQPCLVFLHEGLGCTQMWGDFPRLLCEKIDCPGLIYDRLGYGRSSALQNRWNIHYLHEYALFELPVVLNRLLPGRPFVLIGHSDGASIGLIHAAGRNPLLRGLITEAAHVFVEPETVAGVDAAAQAWENGNLKGLHRYHGENTAPVFRAWSGTWRAPWFRTWSLKYLLPAIEIPVLAIQGADDRYGTAKQLAAIVAGSRGQTRSELIENCGHSPHRDAQAQVLERMTNFLRTLGQSPTSQ